MRSLQGILIVWEVLRSLMWEAFWKCHDAENIPIINDIIGIKTDLSSKTRCDGKFSQILTESDDIWQQFKG